MKKYFLTGLLFLTYGTTSLFAQWDIDRVERLVADKEDSTSRCSNQKTLINLCADAHINSNAITNHFLGVFLYGNGYIDNSIKDEVNAKISPINRLGLDASASLMVIHKTDKLDFMVGLKHRELVSSSFSKELYELVFRGNKQFAGQTVNLSETNLTRISYESLFLGVRKNLSSSVRLAGGLSLIRGLSYNQIAFKNTTFYTETQGQNLTLNYDMQANFDKRSASDSYFKTGGWGAGLTAQVSFRIKEKNFINAEISDLGFIVFDSMNVTGGAGSYDFTGLQYADILDPTQSLVGPLTSDSLLNMIGLKTETKSLTVFLPPTVHVNYVFNPNKRFAGTAGIKYIPVAGYWPRIYLRGTDYFKSGFILSSTASFGGWGLFDWEIGLAKTFGKSFMINANVFLFEYLVLSKSSSGHGINVGMTAFF